MLPTSLVVEHVAQERRRLGRRHLLRTIGVYKPHARAYATAARWTGLEPAQILMVACHNFDLNAAHKAGFRTAFVRRPAEWGPAGPPDPNPNMSYDIVVSDFDALVQAVLSSRKPSTTVLPPRSSP